MAPHLKFPITCHCGWEGTTDNDGECPECGCSPYLPKPDEGCTKKEEQEKENK
jgi:hypothetical protein